MLAIRIDRPDGCRDMRRFTAFDERMIPDPHGVGAAHAQITLSSDQAEELAKWLAVKVFGVRISKACD